MLLSIIIPFYNVPLSMFGRCLSSLHCDERYSGKYEIIVVNDGSQIDPDEILSKPENKLVKCIVQENQGLACARNTGLRESVGKFIYFVDSDDYLSDHSLEAILDWIETNEAKSQPSDLLKVSFRRTQKDSNPLSIRGLSCESYDPNEYFVRNNMPCPVWQYVVRRATLFTKDKEVFSIPNILNEDELWTVSMMRNISRVDISEDKVYNYVWNPTSIMHDSTNIERKIKSWDRIAEEFNKLLRERDLPYFCVIRIRKSVLAQLYLIMGWQKVDKKYIDEYIDSLKANSLYPFILTKHGFTFKMKVFGHLANSRFGIFLLYKILGK